jgi:hypothetical protein
LHQLVENKREKKFPKSVTRIRDLMEVMRSTVITMLLGGIVAGLWAKEETVGKTMPLPENYREWVWLSSGLGMSYSAGAAAAAPSFDNVFASPDAYRVFKATGGWPDKTVLMLEFRNSASNSSINQSGHFQTERTDVEAHVKDEHGRWAFYSFGNGSQTGALIPKQANCYSCHEQHGAVDTTFVQFYPTLLEIAEAKGKVSR